MSRDSEEALAETDYSGDTKNETPLKFAKMVDRVEYSIQALDGTIDRQLGEVGKIALQIKIDMVSAVDHINNHVNRKLGDANRRIDTALRVLIGALIVLLASHAFVVYFETVRLGHWRAHGRDIQLEILDRMKALEERPCGGAAPRS